MDIFTAVRIPTSVHFAGLRGSINVSAERTASVFWVEFNASERH
jgi:hypothetical protein